MADNTTNQEPSIEEILASIRQIISDDDQVAPEAAVAEEPVEVATIAPAEEPVPVAEETPDILELTEALDNEEPEEDVSNIFENETYEPPRRVQLDLQESEDEGIVEKITPVIEDAADTSFEDDMLQDDESSEILTSQATHAALAGFAKLSSNIALERSRSASTGGVTLEDIVRELVRPMLREWLDANLPTLIEKTVQKELDKIAKRALDE